ncbi:MAG TPA: hypothetical protein VGE45_12220 [Chloroflexia bacterium]|jgi:hypothetical protein
MARSIDLFADTDAPLDDFAQELASLLALKLEACQDDLDTWYEIRTPKVVLTVGEHDFEPDRDMNFGEYRYHISVRALNTGNGDERREWIDTFARQVFQKLKATGKYPLILTDDLQTKLEEYQPSKLNVTPVAPVRI